MRETTQSPAVLEAHDAEVAVLAAVLMEPHALTAARKHLDVDAFTRASHQHLWRAMVALATKGEAIDPLTLSHELERRGVLQAVGGKEYVAEIIDAVPTAANVEHHAAIVRECAERRRILQACERISAAARDQITDVEAIAQEAMQSFLPMATASQQGQGFRRADAWRVVEEIESRGQTDVPGLPTGFPELDDHTHGFRPGELVIVGGVAKGGKTALSLEVTRHVTVERGAAVGVVSAEMSRESLIERLLNAESGVSVTATARGRLVGTEAARLARAAGVLSAAPLYIDDAALPSLDDIHARALALVAEHGPISLLVVDFLQLVRHSLKGRRGDEELTAISYGLKGLAKRLGCVVLAPCQLNYKDVERRTSPRPTFADLAGSSGMMQAADFVMLTHREAMYNPMADDTLEVIARGRRVPDFTAKLRWDGQHMRVLSPRKAPTLERLEVA